ncbi:MAG: DUF87 domain-containing protein [Burkholderiales bacterium]
MSLVTDAIMASDNPLAKLLDEHKTAHVGYVYGLTFTEAMVLTNDAWKERVAGVPHNSFLIAAGFDPENFTAAHEFDREVVLLRVLEPVVLPSDRDLVRTVIEHNQRRTEGEVFGTDQHDGHDPITHNELQFGGIRCRILGTFYMQDGKLRLGSDLENYMSCTRLRVFKPSAKALEAIINHVNPETAVKAAEEAKKAGFTKVPAPLEIGSVRYTSTARLHRAPAQPLVPVRVQPADFFARRTAVLGMTRTGKSNTVKTQVAATHLAAKRGSVVVGQIIFDVNGEYANANHQDDGSSIADVFVNDTVRYRAVEMPAGSGFQDLRTNFYAEPAQALNLLSKLTKDSIYRGQGDLDEFLESSLEQPDPGDWSATYRWQVMRAIYQCILHEAGYALPPGGLNVRFPVNAAIVAAIATATGKPPLPAAGKGYVAAPIAQVVQWFIKAREMNYALRAQQRAAGQDIVGLVSSSGDPWVDPKIEAYLNVLARENSRGNSIYGYRTIAPHTNYHSPHRTADVVDEIITHMLAGKIVILDLSAGPVEVRTVLSERIARQIFDRSMGIMNAGQQPPNMVIYVEEAHNLIGRESELTDTWPRIAKEGAKARIAFVYATQEPSSVHPNILSNTENWYVTHLNNDDELKALSKFYDFADFRDSLKNAQDVGFARIKTLSSPFVIPTQIHRFTPATLKAELASVEAEVAAAEAAAATAKAGAAPAVAVAAATLNTST